MDARCTEIDGLMIWVVGSWELVVDLGRAFLKERPLRSHDSLIP